MTPACPQTKKMTPSFPVLLTVDDDLRQLEVVAPVQAGHFAHVGAAVLRAGLDQPQRAMSPRLIRRVLHGVVGVYHVHEQLVQDLQRITQSSFD